MTSANDTLEDDDQLLCTVYTALLNFAHHHNLLPNNHLYSLPSPKRTSPVTRVPRRVLGKRRSFNDDEECESVMQPEAKRPHLMAIGGSLVCAGRVQYQDPYLDVTILDKGSARLFLHSFSSAMNYSQIINSILLSFMENKSVDYNTLLYLVESMVVLSLQDSVNYTLFSQVIYTFMSGQLCLLQTTDKKNHKLAIFMDIYRLVSRLEWKSIKWNGRILQLACELIINCFECAAGKSAAWSHFSVSFCSMLASKLFSPKSAHFEPLCSICKTILSSL